MKKYTLSGASLLPFHVGKSKRSAPYVQKKLLQSRQYHHLLRTLLPDPHFDWLSITTHQKNQTSIESKDGQTKRSYKMIPITLRLIGAISIHVLPNRRLCFGGELLNGIFLPHNKSVQIELIKRFIIWYSPCFEDKMNTFRLDRKCLMKRQNQFLKMYLNSMGYHN